MLHADADPGAIARAGASVAVLDKSARIGSLVRSLIDGRLPVAVHHVDLNDRARVVAVTDEIAARLGTPTILVNNAGLGSSPDAPAAENGAFETYPESAWDAMLDSHLKTALFASQAFIAAFRRAASGPSAGSIINISSTYGVVTPDQSVYAYRRAAGEDYYKPVGYSVAKSGVLTFGPGVTAIDFTVAVLPNTRDDGDRSFTIELSSPTGGATLGTPSTATVLIHNDDFAGTVQWSVVSFSASRTCAVAPCTAALTVKRFNGGASEVTVDYATVDGTGTALHGYELGKHDAAEPVPNWP